MGGIVALLWALLNPAWAEQKDLFHCPKLPSGEPLIQTAHASLEQLTRQLVDRVTVPSAKVDPGDKTPMIELSVLSEPETHRAFLRMARWKTIPFRYPEDGCYARAYKMSWLLERDGIKTAKVFLEGDLEVKTPHARGGKVHWWYHVAPIVQMKKGNKVIMMVFDPSLFNRPAPLDEWVRKQTAHNPKQKPMIYFRSRFVESPSSDANETGWPAEEYREMARTLNQYKAVQDRRQSARPR